MKVFISGASGLVGGNCLQHFKNENINVIGSYFSYPTPNTVFYNTLNPDDNQNFDLIAFAPNVIVHCGALTHVDYCESHSEESYEKTVQSTINLLAIAKKIHAKLVYISTDYVFDGQHGPYTEYDEQHPLSVYASHKAMAEKLVLHDDPQHLVLRVTNVYGQESRHKNFVSRIIQQCLNNEKIQLKLPIDQYATPVNAADIAQVMLHLLQKSASGVFHVAGAEFVNRVELALMVLKHFPGIDYAIESVTTEALQQPAPRPLLGGLIKKRLSMLLPTYQFGTVDEFVKSQIQMYQASIKGAHAN